MAYGNILADVVQSSTTGTAPVFKDGTGTQTGTLCRAWVNFDGTSSGTITPRGSFNVTSVTKNTTGDYTVNFTTAMPDANYSAVSTNSGATASGEYSSGITAMSTSSVRMIAFKSQVGNADSTYFCVSVFR